MKNFLTFILVAVAGFVAQAQTELPKEGAVLKIENPTIALSKGEPYSFDIELIRSKRARKAEFEMPKINGSKSFQFTVEQSSVNPDLYTVTLNTANVEPGKYFYLVTSKSRSVHKAKGMSISIEIAGTPSVASNR